MDLMKLVKGAVTDQVMSKIGGAIGLEPKKASSVVEMASAALLGGIMNKAKAPGGAGAILDLAKNTDFSVLDKLGDLIGGTGSAAEAYQKSGSGLLDGLLGGGKAGMLATLAKTLGLDSSVIGKLLTMLAPIVMGVLGKQIKSQNLDASGLTNLLGSQGSVLSNFLPASLSGDLGFGNLVSGAASSAGKAATGAARQATAAAEQAGGGLMKILIPLLVLAGLGWAVWNFVLKEKPVAAVQDAAAAGAGMIGKTASDVVDSVKGGLDIDVSALGETGTTLKNGFTDITAGLTGLAAPDATEASAKGLVEKITGLTGKIEGMGLDKLDGLAKTASTGLIGSFLSSLDALMEKIPAPLRPIVESALKSLKEKLSPFGK